MLYLKCSRNIIISDALCRDLGMFVYLMIMLHHTEFFKSEKVTVLPHPPYSPGLAQYDLFLFPKLKNFLSGRRYKSQQSLGSAISQSFGGLPKSAYVTHFRRNVFRTAENTLNGEMFISLFDSNAFDMSYKTQYLHTDCNSLHCRYTEQLYLKYVKRNGLSSDPSESSVNRFTWRRNT